MAATLSSFVHRPYHQNFESADFSYSYSDLPVVKSKRIFECPVFPRDSYASLPKCPQRNSLNVKCEKNDEKQQQKCVKDLKRFIFETECTNLSTDCNKESKNDLKRSLGPSKSFGRVEGLKKKFEFQSRLSKSIDKSQNDNGKLEPDNDYVKSQSLSKSSSRVFSNNVVSLDKKISSKASNSISPVKFAINNININSNNSAINIHKLSPKTLNDHKSIQIESHKLDIKSKVSLVGIKTSTSAASNVPFSLPEQQTNRPAVVKSNSLDEKSNWKQSSDKESERCSNLASSVLRLRNSIFSSLKLPRKVSSKMSSQQQLSNRENLAGRSYAVGGGPLSSSATNNNKRKSAVELLAESKAFYVKSETVLDRKQELPLRVNSTLCTGSNSGTHYATLSGRHRRNGSGGEPLQNQLRRLLGPTSLPSPIVSQEARSQTLKYDRKSKMSYDWDGNSHQSSTNRSHYNSGTFSANSSSGTSGSKGQVKSDPEHSRASTSGCYSSRSLNRPSSSGDNRIFFPDSFVVPKPSRSDPANVFSNSFSIESPFSSPEKIDAKQILSVVDSYDNYSRTDAKIEYYDDRDLIENYSTISPPAEYAVTERSNYRYIRSNSHSHTIKTNQDSSCVINFNSHKSLPDLHKQAEHYSESGRHLAGVGGSGNYLPGCEIPQNYGMNNQAQAVRSTEALSCYSKGTSIRSYRSPALSSKGSDGYSRRSASGQNSEMSCHTGRGSADEAYYYNRSGSSYARDSGGSSGHCSGPLGPPSLRGLQPVQTGSLQQRRDSGSSTQHSSTRSHRYSSYYMDRYQEADPNDASHLEYHVSAPLQFQDGVQFNHSSNGNQLNVNATVSISTNFTPRNEGFRTSGTAHIEACQTNDRPALVGIHFQASIPPVQFQDAQTPMYTYNSSYSSEGFYGRRESGTRESRHHLTRRPASSGCNQQPNSGYEEDREVSRLSHDAIESPPGLLGLGNFKRQRCLRYKQRPSPRRPILRSKSDISDRYWRGDDKGPKSLMEKSNNTPPSSDNNSPSRAAQIKLDKFFDQLGMDDETYKDVILKDLKKPRRKDRSKSKSSPSHPSSRPDIDTDSKCSEDEGNDELSSSFASSEISFPDSNLIPNNADYTVQGAANDKPYRSCEPLSIVERNARIIKWLCNCRKLQAV